MNELFSIEISTFKETSYFVSDQQMLESQSVMMIGFKIHPNESTEFFLDNWREVSGLGNLLLFLSPNYCVRKIMFLENVKKIPKKEKMFQYCIMLSISHKPEDIIYLLDFVQKARNGDHVGFMAVYKEIPVKDLKESTCDISVKKIYEKKDKQGSETLRPEIRTKRQDISAPNIEMCGSFCKKYFHNFSKMINHIKINHTNANEITETNRNFNYRTPEEMAFLLRYRNLLREVHESANVP